MEIKIKPNYSSVDFQNIPGNYTFFQNLPNNVTWIYSSVNLVPNTPIRITQDGGNIVFATVQSSTPLPGTFLIVLNITNGVLISFPNVIIAVDEIVDDASFYLDGVIEVLLNYKIYDLKDLKRSSAFSKTIEVPFTANNDKIFSQIFNVNVSIGYNPKKKSDCEITDGGVLIISGYLQLQEIDLPNKLYKCVFYGELKNLFDDVGDKLIFGNNDTTSDLNFSDIIHQKTNTVIESSWNNQEKFVYGLVNDTADANYWRSRQITGTAIPSEKLYPFTKAKYVWDKIFDKFGYSYNSEFLNSDRFTNLLILPSLRPSAQIATSSAEMAMGFSASGTQSLTQFGSVNNKRDFLDFFDSAVNSDIGSYIGNGKFIVNRKLTKIRVRTKLTFWSDPINGGVTRRVYTDASGQPILTPGGGFYPRPVATMKLTLFVNRSSTPFFFPSVSFKTTSEGIFNDFIYRIRSYNLDEVIDFSSVGGINRGDEIGFLLTVEGNQTIDPLTLQTNSNLFFNYFLEKFDSLNTTNFISISAIDTGEQNILQTFSGIKQVDFIGDIIKMFNLYISPDKINPKRLLIEPRDQFYSSGKNVDYLGYDVNSTNISYLTDMASKTYKLTYSKGEDVLNKSFQELFTNRVYGDALINLENDFISNEKKIELKAQPTQFDNIFYNQWVPSQISTSDSGANLGFGYHFFYYSATQSLFGSDGTTTSMVYNLLTGSTGSTASLNFTYSYFPAIDNTLIWRNTLSESVLFSANILEKELKERSLYYLYYENEIESYVEPLSHILTLSVYMDTNLFNRINFNDIFYFEVGNNAQYYTLLEILNYNPAKPGMVTMKFFTYYSFINRPKRTVNPGDIPDVIGGGGGSVNSDLTSLKDNILIGDGSYKYQIAGSGNMINSGKQSVFVYGDNNFIEADNVVTYDSGKTHSTPNTFNFGSFNPVLKDQDYTGVTATPGMIVYGGTSSLYIRGIDNNWYRIDLTKIG